MSSLLPERSKSAPRLTRSASTSRTPGTYPNDDDQILKRFQRRNKTNSTQVASVAGRNKDRLVDLLSESQLTFDEDDLPEPPEILNTYQDQVPLSLQYKSTGRIAIYCTANAFDLKGLGEHLKAAGYRCDAFPEVLYSRYMRRVTGQIQGDILLFEYGVVVFWDLTPKQERSFLENTLKRFEIEPLAAQYVESDTFHFQYVPYAKPTLTNDVVTIAPNQKDAQLTKIAISLGLSQSTKLSVVEERVGRIANITRTLPSTLAKEGKVSISPDDIAKLMGRVFIEQSQLNLLGTVLDTPEFFDGRNVPDSQNQVYNKVWEYLELQDRIEVVNTRLQVLHSMLDMLRNQQVSLHSEKMELVVIILILIDVAILLFQAAASVGWVGVHSRIGASLFFTDSI